MKNRAAPKSYKCQECGKPLVDVGGYWGCLCTAAQWLKDKYPHPRWSKRKLPNEA